MVAVSVAIASSALVGASVGVVVATTSSRGRIRPRQCFRDHRCLAKRSAGCVAVAGSPLAIAAVLAVRHQRAALALTCATAGMLLALASWIVSIEPDDDGPDEAPSEPEWWPDFERELAAWTRRTRVRVGKRS